MPGWVNGDPPVVCERPCTDKRTWFRASMHWLMRSFRTCSLRMSTLAVSMSGTSLVVVRTRNDRSKARRRDGSEQFREPGLRRCEIARAASGERAKTRRPPTRKPGPGRVVGSGLHEAAADRVADEAGRLPDPELALDPLPVG